MPSRTSAEPTAPLRREALQLTLQFATRAHRETLPRHRVARWLRAALRTPAEITVRVVGSDEGRALNRDFRAKDYPTNVLTFDYERAPQVRADLVLCAPVIAREAKAQAIALEAHYAHLLVHGALHAQGFDHDAEADAVAMEAMESAILVRLRLADPHAVPPRGGDSHRPTPIDLLR